MTAGGLDLSPHLLDTFVALGKGLPSTIAQSISKEYNAYVIAKKHLENCKLIAESIEKEADHLMTIAGKLK